MTTYTKADPIEVRLWSQMEAKANGCREWTGHARPAGYGRIWFNGKETSTHRVAWELANGPIPTGLHVLHHCDNPPCGETEPSEAYPEGHLFLGTVGDNNADMTAKGRGHNQNETKTCCPQGHFYSEANTYVNPRGSRECRICKRTRAIRYNAKKRSH